MARLILLRGPICGGKSSAAEALKKLLSRSSVIDPDVYKVQINHRRSSRWRRKMALRIALFATELLIQKNRNVIVQLQGAALGEYRQFCRLAKRYQCPVVSFLLYPPLDVCLERNHSRPIANIGYVLSDDTVEKYWRETVILPNETCFDTSRISTQQVVKAICDSFK